MTNTRTIWARHDADAKWHAIHDVQEGGSAITYCRGRRPATETAALDTEPAVEDRCGRCVVKTLAESLRLSDLAGRVQ